MKKLVPLTLFLLSYLSIFATHNRAGEITVSQIGDFTIDVSITSYTQLTSVSADRDSLRINYGDGNTQLIARVNGPDMDGNGVPDGVALPNNVKQNIYRVYYTYADFGTYLLSLTDPNRFDGIINVNFPTSSNVPFHIETEFTLVDWDTGMTNSSPVFLESPIDVAFVNQPFVHVPNAFDIDGDSIAYELITPMAGLGLEVPNYQFPSQIISGPNNVLNLDPETGILTWAAPQEVGEYVVAISIKSFRNGQQIGYIIRDMQIFVKDEEELTPEISFLGAPENVVTPVYLGDTVRISFDIAEPDEDQTLFVSSSCGLYDFYNNVATFQSTVNGNTGIAMFEWIVTEEHLRAFPYQLVVKAVGSESADALASFTVFRFRTADFVASDDEISVKGNTKLFPNPANDFVFLKTDLSYPLNFTLFDAKGAIVLRDVMKGEGQSINIQTLPNGFYQMQLTGKNGAVSSVRLIIAR